MKTNDDIEFEPLNIKALNVQEPMRQILPYEFNTDGFFIAKFKKKA